MSHNGSPPDRPRSWRRLIGSRRTQPQPPGPTDRDEDLSGIWAENENGQGLVQLNFRVPHDLRRRVRMLAARDNRSLADFLRLAIGLYEDKHGRT